MSPRGRVMPLGVALVGTLVFFAGWWGPLARPGYELALVTGLVAPSVVAVVSALEARKRPLEPRAAYHRALGLGASAAFSALAVASVHGARTGFCEVAEGVTIFALGPMMGMVMASVWGLVAAECAVVIRRGDASRAHVVAAALAGPLSTIVLGLLAFYATPMVFAYDPFVGFFSGAVYDTVIPSAGLVTYRAFSLATLVGLGLLSGHVERGGRGVRLVTGAPWFERALASWLLALAMGSAVFGDRLDTWHTSRSIERALGAETRGATCRVVHSPASGDEAKVLARECDAHAAELAAWMGLREVPPIVAYLFQSADERRRYMGATHTSIAKPWRREVYLESAEFPHPVLRHELAHVLAGELARGPFRVAGRWHGLIPDPGLIEGMAEAAAPRDDDLSADEWAAAMRKLGLLPRIPSLFGLGFFGGASSASYTAAGSFVGFVRRHYGADGVGRWYHGDSLTSVTGRSEAELEVAWWSELDGVPLGDSALGEARLRFDHPGVFARACPHAVDRLTGEAVAKEPSDPESARALYRRVLALDPLSARALFGEASCFDHEGKGPEAVAALEALTTHVGLPEAARATAAERLGDLALRAGNAEDARRWYDVAARATFAEDKRRTLDVKGHYAADALARRALIALLVGDGVSPPNPVEASDLLGQWRAESPADGVPAYLLGRQLLHARRYERAIERLDEALGKSMLPRTRAESLRLRVRAAAALGRCDDARSFALRYVQLEDVAGARRQALDALARRCR